MKQDKGFLNKEYESNSDLRKESEQLKKELILEEKEKENEQLTKELEEGINEKMKKNISNPTLKLRKLKEIRAINKEAIKKKENEDIKKLENKIKDMSKEIYKESFYMIINDL